MSNVTEIVSEIRHLYCKTHIQTCACIRCKRLGAFGKLIWPGKLGQYVTFTGVLVGVCRPRLQTLALFKPRKINLEVLRRYLYGPEILWENRPQGIVFINYSDKMYTFSSAQNNRLLSRLTLSETKWTRKTYS